jgi:hypothetical protein
VWGRVGCARGHSYETVLSVSASLPHALVVHGVGDQVRFGFVVCLCQCGISVWCLQSRGALCCIVCVPLSAHSDWVVLRCHTLEILWYTRVLQAVLLGV